MNNDLYIGRLTWNRQRFIKDPHTGKRQARMNPESEWVIEDVPDLRIIEDDIWHRVKERQQGTRRRVVAENQGIRSERARRPKYLLSGLLQCGVCGGGYRHKVENLIEALNAPDTVSEAADVIRTLIEAVRLTPKDGKLSIELYGELAALLSLGMQPNNKHPRGDTSGVQVTMVAGIGFEPMTFRL